MSHWFYGIGYYDSGYYVLTLEKYFINNHSKGLVFAKLQEGQLSFTSIKNSS